MKKPPIPEDFGLSVPKIETVKKEWDDYILSRDTTAKTCERIVMKFAVTGGLISWAIFTCYAFYDFGLFRGLTIGHLFSIPLILLMCFPAGAVFGGLAGGIIGYLPGKIIFRSSTKPILSLTLRQEHDALVAYENAQVKWIEREKRCQREFWTKMDGWNFETEIAKLFRKRGFDAKVTKGSGDGGVDILLNRDGEKTVVQCKQHKTAVPPAAVRDLYGVLTHHNAQKAMLVSTSGFTNGTVEFARNKPIELLGIEDILKMADESE